MNRKVIAFAGSAVAVEWEGKQASGIVDLVLGNAPTGDDVPLITYQLESQGGTLTLRQDGRLVYGGSAPFTAAELLMGGVCRRLAERSRGGLLFHAAGLAWQGRGLLMPGTIAAGKTTLAAYLTLKGFDYLTDELVFIPEGSTKMETFTRPLNLKYPSRDPLVEEFDFAGNEERFLSHPRGDLVPPTLLNPDNTLSEPGVTAIVFPRYAPGDEFAFASVTAAQAGLALTECQVNARTLPAHGLGQVAQLAKSAPAYRLRYRHFQQIGDRIQGSLG